MRRSLLELLTQRTSTTTENDIQSGIYAFLTLAELGLSEAEVARTEVQVDNKLLRRIDILHGNLIIEVKKDVKNVSSNERDQKQLASYMSDRQVRDDRKYAGVITNGLDWYFYDLKESGDLEQVDSYFIDTEKSDAEERFTTWLSTILLSGKHLKVTPEIVAERLGADSPRLKLNRKRLTNIYSRNAGHSEIQTKQALWSRLLRTALGTNFKDNTELFLDHTLLVIEAEIIAHLLIGANPLNHTARELVSGEVFQQASIYNVVAPDFFDWVADAAEGEEFIHSLARELSQFDWSDIQHDVIKVLYESIIDKDIRKSLGEYYTPDWLAKRIVDGIDGPLLDKKCMDPSCGSGTFLFHLIRRYLREGSQQNIDRKALLSVIQDSVFGVDIHPVSVVLARVTYLLALGAPNLAGRGTITVPVFLGDSIQWVRDATLNNETGLKVDTQGEELISGDEPVPALFSSVDTLVFPLSLIRDASSFERTLNKLVNIAAGYKELQLPTPSIENVLADAGNISDDDAVLIRESFKTLCRLNAQGRDHIWGYFLINQMRPLWFSMPENRVDYLVGNPPWVAYRFMTPKMKRRFKRLAKDRNLWTGGNVSTHQDLVSLFVARTVEQFLKPYGRFAFVVPLAVLSRTHYEHFRSGIWATNAPDGDGNESQKVRVTFDNSWDLSGIQPSIFEVPAAVIFGSRSETPSPLPHTNILFAGSSTHYSETTATTVQLDSSSIGASPYSEAASQGASLVPRMLLIVQQVDPPNRLGLPDDQGYFTSYRSNLEKAPWKDLPSIKGAIELRFVHQMIAGQSIGPFRLLDLWQVVLPLDGTDLLSEQQIAMTAPALGRWWATINETWEAHKESKLTLYEQIDYRKKLTRQLSNRRPRLVYTASGINLCAALVDNENPIIDSSLYWVPLDSQTEGHYLCAILNSDTLGVRLRSIQSLGNFGPRHFSLLPWYFNIPRFVSSNALHKKIADLGAQAQSIASAVNLAGISNFKTKRKRIEENLNLSVAEEINLAVDELLGV